MLFSHYLFVYFIIDEWSLICPDMSFLQKHTFEVWCAQLFQMFQNKFVKTSTSTFDFMHESFIGKLFIFSIIIDFEILLIMEYFHRH